MSYLKPTNGIPTYADYKSVFNPNTGATLQEDLATKSGIIDVSEVAEVVTRKPQVLAKVNILCSSLPTTKTADIDAEIEYSDNFITFKKPIVINAQGESTLSLIKKNYTIDFTDSEIKFGKWVSQDSFHLKAYYSDYMCVYEILGYTIAEQAIQHLGCRANRNLQASTTINGAIGTFSKDMDIEPLLHPDGFPIEVYHNGSYLGLYVWRLKKHRDNYEMKKGDYSAIHLDGLVQNSTMWNGTVGWSSFEIRNPKKLILTNGYSEYDGDNPQEIIGASNPAYDPDNEDHVNTDVTKQAITRLAGACSAISSASDHKGKFAEYFDVDMFICYYVVSKFIVNVDGWINNWQWCLYNGKWSPNFYDIDKIFGRDWLWSDHITYAPNNNIPESGLSSYSEPIRLLRLYYQDEINAAYAALRDAGVFSVGNVMAFVYDWLHLCGKDAIKANIDKWTQTPNYRADNAPAPYTDGTNSTRGYYDSPLRIRMYCEARLNYLDTYFDYSK